MITSRPSILGNVVLYGLLGLLFLAVVFADRSDWPGFIGDESTYLMATESLAWDFDLYYERQDYDRFVGHWGKQNELLLFLQSDDHGKTLAYAKPFFYPLFAAPLARIAPLKGALLANVLILTLAAFCCVRALGHLGPATPIWVATFLFGSVAFAYCFWAHADLFFMALTAIALALAFEHYHAEGDLEDKGEPRLAADRRALWVRWLLVGICLAIVGFSRPFYLTLFIPALLAAPRSARKTAWSCLALGTALIVVPAILIHLSLAGAWTGYTGERGGFYGRSGLPAVDFPPEDWDEAIHRSGNFSWYLAREPLQQKTRISLWSWNTLYFFVGRHVGLVPYFLPFLLGLSDRPRGWARWALIVAVAASTAALFFYRPFNFYGGGAAIGNRYFLPLYPATWFLISRRRSAAWPLTAIVAGALFLWPVWTQATDYPFKTDYTYRFVSRPAYTLLPYETTLSHIKPGGQEDVLHRGLWVKMLTPTVHHGNGEAFSIRDGEWAELLIATQGPLDEIDLVASGGVEIHLSTKDGRLEPIRSSDGRWRWQLRLRKHRARHPMWWTWEPLYLYHLELRLDGVGEEFFEFYLEPTRPGGSKGPLQR